MENVGVFGDTFGALNTIFSGMAFAVLVITLSKQSEELKLQREELQMQREEIKLNRQEMARSSNALAMQVKVSSLSARLQILPVLIAQQKERLASSTDHYQPFGKYSYTSAVLRNSIRRRALGSGSLDCAS